MSFPEGSVSRYRSEVACLLLSPVSTCSAKQVVVYYKKKEQSYFFSFVSSVNNSYCRVMVAIFIFTVYYARKVLINIFMQNNCNNWYCNYNLSKNYIQLKHLPSRFIIVRIHYFIVFTVTTFQATTITLAVRTKTA